MNTILRILTIVCVLALLLTLAAACNSNPQPPSDSVVVEAAKKFAVALERAGEDAQEIIEKARVEAKKWGPKAELFIQTVIDELQK